MPVLKLFLRTYMRAGNLSQISITSFLLFYILFIYIPFSCFNDGAIKCYPCIERPSFRPSILPYFRLSVCLSVSFQNQRLSRGIHVLKHILFNIFLHKELCFFLHFCTERGISYYMIIIFDILCMQSMILQGVISKFSKRFRFKGTSLVHCNFW